MDDNALMKSVAWVLVSVTLAHCTPGLSDSPTEPQQSLEVRLAAQLDALQATTSLYARHLPSGREVAVRADAPMNTLSVVKIPIMVLAYRDAEAGLLDLDERHRVTAAERRRGSGLIQTFTPGLELTYRDLVTQMIVTSDNTATDVLIKRLGLDRVNGLMDEFGYEKTRLLATTGDLFRVVWTLQDRKYAASGRQPANAPNPVNPDRSTGLR